MADGESPPEDAEVKRLVRQHWRRRAATFDEEPEHAIHSDAQRERWLEVLEAWTPDPPRRTLDVGCGTGTIAVLLADLGHVVVGVDAAPEMVVRAREKAVSGGHDLPVALGDATGLGLVDDAVELVVERHLLWTLPDPVAALAEWRRVLEPGGRLVCFEGRWDHDEVRGEYEAIHEDLPLYAGAPASEMAAVLAEAGFEATEAAPLTDPVLRGREGELDHDYFVLAGTVPE